MRRSVVAVLCLACAGPRDVPAADKGPHAAPGAPLILERTPITYGGAYGAGLRVNYETTVPITDVPALRAEAEELWQSLRPEVERAGYCTVELKASEQTRRLPLGGERALTARRNFSFLVRHTRPDGWEWPTALTRQPPPCVGQGGTP